MGVDISACSGVVVTVDQMTAIVREDNREQTCRALLRHTATLLKSLKDEIETEEYDEWDHRSKQQQAALLTTVCRDLSIEFSVDDIRLMLKNLTTAEVDGYSSYVRNSEEAIEIWGMLINELHPNAPVPESTEYINSPRYQGWDLPQGEVLFVFSEDECFERVKTQAGAVLDEMLEETTELSRWTDYSI